MSFTTLGLGLFAILCGSRAPAPLPEKLRAWPRLEAAEAARVLATLDLLEASAEAEAREDLQHPPAPETWAERLRVHGDGALPLVLVRLAADPAPASESLLARTLARLLDERQTRLAARELRHPSRATRIVLLELLARHPDRGTRGLVELAFERAAPGPAAGAAESSGAPDNTAAAGSDLEASTTTERDVAACASVACGSTLGLSHLIEIATRRWPEERNELMRIAREVRGAEATLVLLQDLEHLSGTARTLAVLRLLGACGEGQRAVLWAKRYLSSTKHAERVAAVNALRGMLDEDPPLELSGFDAARHVQEWKERLR